MIIARTVSAGRRIFLAGAAAGVEMPRMISNRLKELGLEPAAVSKPLASYTPAKRTGDLIFVSGQLPLVDGNLTMTGPMTPERDIAEAAAAMEICFLNGLAAAASVTELDRIKEVVRLGAFVASTPEFKDEHKVANGASDL